MGENFRKALLSSEYFNQPGEKSLGWENILPMEEASNLRRRAFDEEMRQAYGFKTIEAMWKKDDMVSSNWHYRVDDFVTIYALRRSHGGGHSGWPEVKFPQKNLDVPLSVSDEELGQALLEIWAQCECSRGPWPASLGKPKD
ncbi:contact-dependent growth inhibition system immunity protein [Acetobacter farinalis]|uniref:Contact-dependent growth inhibition system immunity protein n=1 Tax=Acetobacter farinalis TaxID=1260984 RepID=A0ABT3Q8W1_9PROT|nr:contact-dependent growth inhibition system immunity protein [Acetobacter farinalis]MCX2561676.1 contact-dependent growth inhibition system immunity protein [Acetobacter farinalis]